MITTKYKLSLADLKRFKLTPPEGAGSHWHGISHYNLVRTILQVYNEFEPVYTSSAVSKNKQEFTAYFSLSHPGRAIQLGLALRTSNARRHALMLYTGGFFPNGKDLIPAVLASVKAGRHQFLDTYDAVDSTLDKIAELISCMVEAVEIWKSIQLTNTQVQEFLCKIGAAKILPWSRLGVMHFDLSPLGTTKEVSKWDLYAALALQIKRSPPLTQLDQLLRATELLNS
jgi:hypothetical protein